MPGTLRLWLRFCSHGCFSSPCSQCTPTPPHSQTAFSFLIKLFIGYEALPVLPQSRPGFASPDDKVTAERQALGTGRRGWRV